MNFWTVWEWECKACGRRRIGKYRRGVWPKKRLCSKCGGMEMGTLTREILCPEGCLMVTGRKAL